MEFKLDKDTIGDIAAVIFGGYAIYTLTGGQPIPILATVTPWVVGIAGGFVIWHFARKNNRAQK